ncbi:HAD family hydrolase [Streptomyces paludis]|uniref:HAD family hydrolase n=1 Tax=Streptomyces paludis TaxID=2282738 RepID=A0A345HRB1_9ACTN|nr:HAD-IA family hydrolase [Streptomyces paludis]AXG79235.1 HAD family hydrolase [Streptomyces paludis]
MSGASDLVRAVLFDLDGTLAETAHITAAALTWACDQTGVAGGPPTAEFHALSGLPLEEIVGRLGLPEAVAELYRKAAGARVAEARLFPGALTLLSVLRARGVRVGVITGKDRPRTLATLDHLKIADLVEALVTPADPPAPKPSPEGVWWLCRHFGVPTESALLVGDSEADMAAGRAAGIRTVACGWGVGRSEALARHRPWRALTRFGELTVLLDGLTTPPTRLDGGAPRT